MNNEKELDRQNEKDILESLLNTEEIPIKNVLMKRFGVSFKIKGLETKVVNRIRKRCEFPVKNKRLGKIDKELDSDKFNASLIKEACLEPKWDHLKLLEKYSTHDPIDVIQQRLLAGEMSRLGDEILTLSGFDDGTDIEEIKNSFDPEEKLD